MANKGTGQPSMGTQFQPQPPNTDWKKLEKSFESEIQKGLKKLRLRMYQHWYEKAQDQFSSKTADDYLRGLRMSVDSKGITATLDGWKPVALENGIDPFDMKRGLLAGRQSRVIPLANGNFRTVSTNSPPDSWWHPGIEGRKISEQMKQEVPKLAQEIFKDVFSRIKV